MKSLKKHFSLKSYGVTVPYDSAFDRVLDVVWGPLEESFSHLTIVLTPTRR